jgi:4-methylaminobutanoate oxidase (formaldehyde-forming)
VTASASEPPSRADVVVIGGGVVGASVAYHLAALGCRDVVLLEAARLGSGTTWHSGGNMETYRADPLLGEMVAYTVELFPRLAAETGIDFGWRQPGRVHFTSNAEVFASYRAVPARSRARGVEVELITPSEIVAKVPVLGPDGLLGGLWIPNDGRVEPTNLAMAYARGASRRGARVIEDTRVRRIVVANGRVRGVETDRGPIACEAAVLAAGLWSTSLARGCGVRLPLIGLHHFYLLTRPIAGVGPDLPLYLSYDEAIWGREEVGGLIIGVFDANAIPIEPEELPESFSFSLLPETWEQIEPNMAIVRRRFPVLDRAGIRALVNGPESFTPDGAMLLGEAPGVRGLHLATGMNSNGIALAAGAGRATAERLVHGRTSLDVTALDVRRFLPFQGGDRYRRRRMGELFEVDLLPSAPGRDFARTRGIRRSPAHALWAARGAVFSARAGFEEPQWFGPGDWAPAVADELEAALGAAAASDRSGMAKLLLRGPDSRAVLARASGGTWSGAPVAAATLSDPRGRALAWPLVVALADDELLLLAETGEDVRLAEAVREAIAPEERAVAVDVGAGWGAFGLYGPGACGRLADLAGRPVDPAPGRWEAVDLGFAPALVLAGPAPESRLILVAADFAADLAGQVVDFARPVGDLAVDSARVFLGLRRFPDDRIPVLLGRPMPRLLRASVRAERPGSLAEEPVLAAGRMVGHVTSSMAVPRAGRLALLALVEPGAEGLQVLIDGRPRPLEEISVLA